MAHGAVRGSLTASDAAAPLHTTVLLILMCVCYVIVYVQTEDNPNCVHDLKITLANPTPLLAHPDHGQSLIQIRELYIFSYYPYMYASLYAVSVGRGPNATINS